MQEISEREPDLAFVTVACVVKTQGRIGEVAAAVLTDFPERFADRKRLHALQPDGRRRELTVENHWFHKDQVVFKFAGVDSISQAGELIGCEIQISVADRAPLEAGSVYLSDLAGCRVYDRGREIGTIDRVQFGGGEAPLLVVKGEKEYLIPWAEEYVESTNLERRELRMKLPEGLLELDAPLTDEEKQRQRRQD